MPPQQHGGQAQQLQGRHRAQCEFQGRHGGWLTSTERLCLAGSGIGKTAAAIAATVGAMKTAQRCALLFAALACTASAARADWPAGVWRSVGYGELVEITQAH
jgi:hypothetical protein